MKIQLNDGTNMIIQGSPKEIVEKIIDCKGLEESPTEYMHNVIKYNNRIDPFHQLSFPDPEESLEDQCASFLLSLQEIDVISIIDLEGGNDRS